MTKNASILLISILIMSLAPSNAHPEYLRATEQDEFIFVSNEQETRMGESIARNVERRFGLVDDELLQNKLNAIGQNIAKVCDRRDIGYHFRVILGSELKPEQRINAFALPGGYIYVFKDLLDKLESEDEIAAVLSHEIGHVCAKHNIKRLQASLGALAFQILTSRMETDNETRARAYDAINLLMMSYSREDELMADRLSVKYMKLASYNPEGAIKVIDKLIEIQQKAPIRPYISYRTHPYLSERKATVRKEIHGHMDFVDFINIPSNENK